MKIMKEFKPLINFLGKDKNKLIIASILIFISGIGELFTGYLNGAALESITNLKLKEAIINLLIYLFIQITICGLILHLARTMIYKIESALSRKLGFFTYKKALDLPAVAFEKHSSGEIINRITSDTDALTYSFETIMQTLSQIIGSIIILVYIFTNSWIIGIEIIIMVAVLFIIIKKYNPKLKQIHKDRRETHDNFTSLVTESIRGIREIKTLGVKNNLIKDMIEIIKSIYKKSEKEIDTRKQFNILTMLIKIIVEVGTFITCMIELYYGRINLTFVVAMTYYIYRYMWLIQNFNELSQVYQRTTVSLGRINEILENKLYDDEKFGEKKLDNIQGNIEFKNVHFSYPGEKNTLNNFNLKIAPNQMIAIVGKSGQGKSTLFNLLTRIFDVNKGEILIDGINIKDLNEDELRKHISIIRQEPFIFNKSIKDNFKLINNHISLKEIRKYCKLAYIDDYIMSLPKKYNTILGEGGVNLSGGQKQRLSIARTLCKQSKIILFDEATSALDNQSQETIKKAINNLSKDHTVIVVAHRLSTIIDADIIHLVDKGKVIASGTHQNLLNTNKNYKELYSAETLNS